MNHVILIGNLTKDPEVKVTQSGTKLAKFSIAVNEGKNRDGQEIVQYFNITVWEKTADITELYLKKGHKVAVTGSLQNEVWTKQDGTKGYGTSIRGTKLEMLTSKMDATKLAEQSNSQTSSNYHKNSNQNSDEEISEMNDDQELPEIDINKINSQMPF
jgi:single-strand DNA-binding protein